MNPAKAIPLRAGAALRVVTIAGGMLVGGVAAFAPPCGAEQQPPDPDLETRGMRRFGPFHVRPFLVLQNAGYDDNIRLDASVREGDTTATAGAGAEAVLLTGNRGGIRLAQEFDYVAFGRNTDLNHWNGSGRARGVLILKRLALSLEDRFTSERERPTTEIDRRVRRENNAVTAALRTLRRGRLGFLASARHDRIDYGSEDADSALVAERLNRDENALTLRGEARVLPKTTFILEGVVERVEFANESLGRDTRARSIFAGFQFDPSASIQGDFRVGPLRLEAPDRPQSDHRGVVGDGRLSARLGRRARFKATFARDIGFSVLADNLHYVSTSWTAACEQFFSRRLSGEVLYGRALNHYPETVTRAGTDPFQGIRDDHLTTYRATVRFRSNERVGLQLGAERVARDSTDDFYDRTRSFYTFGTTYAF
jgi:hypothetical protein